MSDAREHFIGRIDAIRTILSTPITIDSTPVPVPNSAAVTIRNGCMVMLFCALEAFIRGRSLECARRLDQIVVPYPHLPAGLKYASLVGTFEGLLQQTKYWSETDKMAEFERAAVLIAAGPLGSPYQFNEYSFARDKSNVSADDMRDITKSFHVDNFWAACSGIWNKVGAVVPGNPPDIYKQLSKERNKAAHVAAHNVTHTAISNFLPQTVALALAFDALISMGAHRLSSSAIAHGTIPAKVSDANVEFITVKPHTGSKWAAFRTSAARAILVQPSPEAAFAAAIPKARLLNLCVVRHDNTGRPVAWATIFG